MYCALNFQTIFLVICYNTATTLLKALFLQGNLYSTPLFILYKYVWEAYHQQEAVQK